MHLVLSIPFYFPFNLFLICINFMVEDVLQLCMFGLS